MHIWNCGIVLQPLSLEFETDNWLMRDSARVEIPLYGRKGQQALPHGKLPQSGFGCTNFGPPRRLPKFDEILPQVRFVILLREPPSSLLEAGDRLSPRREKASRPQVCQGAHVTKSAMRSFRTLLRSKS